MRTIMMLPAWMLLICAFGQAQNNDQAERLLENAVTFMNAGKYKEALADLDTIINSFADTPTASRALLQMGTYYLDVEQNYDKALGYFSQIQSRYAGSEEAPAAFFYKAQIVEDQGQTPAQLEEAVADLIRMSNLYPNNAWRLEANFLFGKLNLRLNDYDLALSHFQRLEFFFNRSKRVPLALLLSAEAAFKRGDAGQAQLILARLQRNFGTSEEAEQAGRLLRSLNRFTQGRYPNLQLDTAFYGATPKQFASPAAVLIDRDNLVGVVDNKGGHFGSLTPGATVPNGTSSRDLRGFTRDRNGRLVLVYKDRIDPLDSTLSFGSLSNNGESLGDIRAAAVDHFGRLFVVDDDVRDMWAFSRDGQHIKSFGLNRPKLVRCYQNEIWVLNNDSDTFTAFNAELDRLPLSGFNNLSDIKDFDFDAFGHLYVLSSKGAVLSIWRRDGTALYSVNLKDGTYPLKTAESVTVDLSGAVYLADRRGGAVYRFQ
ncbi:tetratricopeptide repeat protein [Acanthopleuribacter pedis]|uniref:Tetratricopeptide repeat protein n=1 Tax=Acanthopleuribacter pedis TaxID=442870 RepID=A0A8J7QCB9_9BACT|nr:tetratricopeptide repeat protein [Acanthopleuribacter pedis]MBO1316925.1 tetratricopeptide repeat protein [Acanthopleuribacter pedis]